MGWARQISLNPLLPSSFKWGTLVLHSWLSLPGKSPGNKQHVPCGFHPSAVQGTIGQLGAAGCSWERQSMPFPLSFPFPMCSPHFLCWFSSLLALALLLVRYLLEGWDMGVKTHLSESSPPVLLTSLTLPTLLWAPVDQVVNGSIGNYSQVSFSQFLSC